MISSPRVPRNSLTDQSLPFLSKQLLPYELNSIFRLKSVSHLLCKVRLPRRTRYQDTVPLTPYNLPYLSTVTSTSCLRLRFRHRSTPTSLLILVFPCTYSNIPQKVLWECSRYSFSTELVQTQKFKITDLHFLTNTSRTQTIPCVQVVGWNLRLQNKSDLKIVG